MQHILSWQLLIGTFAKLESANQKKVSYIRAVKWRLFLKNEALKTYEGILSQPCYSLTFILSIIFFRHWNMIVFHDFVNIVIN